MSEAEKFLRDKSIGFYVDNPFYHIGIAVKFKDVIEVMEQYHQSKVNNVVLDGVIKRNHNWNYHLLGFERICAICKEVDMIDNIL